MNKRKYVLILLTALLVNLSCYGQDASILTITATNLKSDDGSAVVNIFREQDDLPKKPFKTVKASITSGVAKLIVHNLPFGSYAAIVYHDKNDNGTLDHKLGFPNEPMGFSNDWNLNLFSGMPSFKKLRFEHSISQTAIEIRVD